MLNTIENNNFSSEAPQHEFYRHNSNAVDLHTRRCYTAYFTYGIRHWRTKMGLSMITCGNVNVFTVLIELSNLDFKVFRHDLAHVLIKYEQEDKSNNN